MKYVLPIEEDYTLHKFLGYVFGENQIGYFYRSRISHPFGLFRHPSEGGAKPTDPPSAYREVTIVAGKLEVGSLGVTE